MSSCSAKYHVTLYRAPGNTHTRCPFCSVDLKTAASALPRVETFFSK